MSIRNVRFNLERGSAEVNRLTEVSIFLLLNLVQPRENDLFSLSSAAIKIAVRINAAGLNNLCRP